MAAFRPKRGGLYGSTWQFRGYFVQHANAKRANRFRRDWIHAGQKGRGTKPRPLALISPGGTPFVPASIPAALLDYSMTIRGAARAPARAVSIPVQIFAAIAL